MNKKNITIIVCCVIAIIILLSIMPNNSNNNEESEVSIIDNPENIPSRPIESTPDSEYPTYESPYNKDDRYFWTFLPVQNNPLPLNNLIVTTSSEPDVQFASKIHRNDTLKIQFDALDGDVSKCKIIGVAHDKMKDPYLTLPDQFIDTIFSAEFSLKEDNWYAEAHLPYGIETGNLIDIILVYNNSIMYYAMIKVDQTPYITDDYLAHAYPDKTIGHFTIKAGNEEYNCMFFKEDGLSLIDWLRQPISNSSWTKKYNRLMSNNLRFYLNEDESNSPINDGAIYTATEYIKPSYEDDIANPTYAIHYLGMHKNDLNSAMGTPLSSETKGSITRMLYDGYILYLENEHVVQITLNPDAMSPAPHLPNATSSTNELYEISWLFGIDTPNYTHKTTSELNVETNEEVYIKFEDYTYTHRNWNVAYHWEYKEGDSEFKSPCKSIIVFSGETYKYLD